MNENLQHSTRTFAIGQGFSRGIFSIRHIPIAALKSIVGITGGVLLLSQMLDSQRKMSPKDLLSKK